MANSWIKYFRNKELIVNWQFVYYLSQELMSRGMQLCYIPVTAFSLIDLFLDRIPLE